jgi:hypothetical protein
VVVIHAPLKIATCASYWADERDDRWKARNAIPVQLPDRQAEVGASRLAELVAEFQRTNKRAGQPRLTDSSPAEPEPPELFGRLNPGGGKVRSIEPGVSIGPSRQKCSRCGARLRVTWQFCPRCGTPAGSGEATSSERRRSSSA